MAFDTRFLRSCISSSTKSLNDGLYQQNQQVSFRFPEIASWRVGGGSFQIDSSQPVKLLISNFPVVCAPVTVTIFAAGPIP
jgi:hypothetical protein